MLAAALRQKRSQPWQGPRRVTGVFVREGLSRYLDALRPMYAPVQMSGWIGTCRMVGRGRLPGSAPPSLKSAASSAQAPASICERSHTDINRYRAGPEQWGGVHEVRQSERAVAALTRPRDAVPVLVASAFRRRIPTRRGARDPSRGGKALRCLDSAWGN